MHLAQVCLPAIMIPSLIDILANSVLANQAMRWADLFPWNLWCIGFIHLVESREPVLSFEFLSVLGYSTRASGE